MGLFNRKKEVEKEEGALQFQESSQNEPAEQEVHGEQYTEGIEDVNQSVETALPYDALFIPEGAEETNATKQKTEAKVSTEDLVRSDPSLDNIFAILKKTSDEKVKAADKLMAEASEKLQLAKDVEKKNEEFMNNHETELELMKANKIAEAQEIAKQGFDELNAAREKELQRQKAAEAEFENRAKELAEKAKKNAELTKLNQDEVEKLGQFEKQINELYQKSLAEKEETFALVMLEKHADQLVLDYEAKLEGIQQERSRLETDKSEFAKTKIQFLEEEQRYQEDRVGYLKEVEILSAQKVEVESRERAVQMREDVAEQSIAENQREKEYYQKKNAELEEKLKSISEMLLQ